MVIKRAKHFTSQGIIQMNTTTQMQLPQYQSIKKVWGLQIKAITILGNEQVTLEFYNKLFSDRQVSIDLYNKHEPKSDWYYVAYKGGYESFCPRKEFEEGNVLIEEEEGAEVGSKELQGQEKIMLFDPFTGWSDMLPTPCHAAQSREFHGLMAWMYNPWTGEKRNPGDIATDIMGSGILVE